MRKLVLIGVHLQLWAEVGASRHKLMLIGIRWCL